MVQLFLDGGGFMWPILIVFIFGLAFVIERIYHLLKGMTTNLSFAESISETILNDGIEAAKSNCEGSLGPVANLCAAALDRADHGAAEAEKSLEQAGGLEMSNLEKNMTWISLSIAIAPMFGFLGTVWGMIEAFNDIKMANDISPAVVAGGISIALLTTAFGLVVALILQLLQNTVMYIIDNQVVTLQKSTSLVINSITDHYNKK